MDKKILLPKKVTICEVAPRDGLQAVSDWIQTEDKIKMVKSLVQTGIPSLEITSFVHPKAIPQLKDAEEVVTSVVDQLEGVDVRALVPNLRGAERAVNAGVKKLKTMLSATDSHSLSNANDTVANAQEKLTPIFEYADSRNITVMGSISVAFGCPFEGTVPVERLIEIIKRYVDMGVREISLADSTGMAQPVQVYDTLGILKEEFPQVAYSMHFHNTRGAALANTFAALQQGVTLYDSSIAGIGGCPYLPNATGNVATEDLVHMLEEMGIHTNVNLDEVIKVAKDTLDLLKVKGDSYMLTAGPTSRLHDKPTRQKKIDE
ncbi:hydroxymethylglutaryl-CoA lyase [Oceanobacillus sp. CFH 90083]|uniref:hydroxymethylglutaryl-CoA lyase n=1 Tax=Oceanobacillus sp. CFH 90083 TaxID=2592336 RepID=UPI001D133DFA|nr:hydroxymethylglutaryl-CoA lyase [Oceanobacillus sp. CFH 90083]